MKTKTCQRIWGLACAILFFAVNYASAFYDPHIGRWINRDPMGEDGGKNVYAFVDNRPTINADALGLCKVYSSGVRYRVNLAALDAYYAPESPYQAFADSVQNSLNARLKPFGIALPRMIESGPVVAGNQNMKAAHFLVFFDWEIDESDGPCKLTYSEKNTLHMNGLDIPINNPERSPQGTVKKVKRSKMGQGCAPATMIYVDAPGSISTFPPQLPMDGVAHAGFLLNVNIHFRITNEKTGQLISTKVETITIGLDKHGQLIANP